MQQRTRFGSGQLPATIAHRGYSAVNPENTLAAIAAAQKAGADYIEIDVHTTADGVPIVLHDQTVDRTTTGTGDVAQLTGAYIAGLEAGSWFSSAFSEQPLPTFEQVLDVFVTGSSTLLLEIKGPETQAEVNRIVDMVTSRGLSSRVVVQSFDENVLRYTKQRAPQLTTGLLRSNLDADPVAVSRELGVTLYNPAGTALLTRPSVIQQLHAAGIAVFVWTVDAAAQWQLAVEAGVDGIITNRPGALIGWKEAQDTLATPPSAAPMVKVVAPTAGGTIERGQNAVLAAFATAATSITLKLDGATAENGESVAASTLALGEHTLTVTASGEGGRADASSKFEVIATKDGVRGRLAALDVSTGQLQQLLSALSSEDWDRLASVLTKHAPDNAQRTALLEEVAYLKAQ